MNKKVLFYDLFKFNILYVVCEKGYENIVKFLLSVGFNVNECWKEESFLCIFCWKGYYLIVWYLLINKDVNVDLCDENECSFFYYVSLNGYMSIVIFLFDKKVNVNICNKDG